MKNLPGPAVRRVGLLTLALLASTVLAASAAHAQQRAVYRDAAAPIEQRVEDLLARMTLDEKIVQLTAIWTQKNQLLDRNGQFDPAAARRLYPNGIGHFARPADLQGPGDPLKTPYRDVRQTIELVNAMQRYARSTRLGIPVLFHEEGLHGYAARGATHFPQAIALASSWDPALLERVFTVAGREIRARGVQLVLAPVVDVGRDPRWGRIEETYGEDPYLVGELGVAAVRGFQGPGLPLAKDRVFATLKHMTGHGQPESGTNVAPANISERILREVYGIDLLNPPEEARGSGRIPPMATRRVWESYSTEKWREIARDFHVTQVLTYPDWTLNLPIAAHSRRLLLYDIR